MSLLNLWSPVYGVSLSADSTRFENLEAGLMHLERCCNFPTRLWNCFRDAFSLLTHVLHSEITSSIFSLGRITVISTVFTVKPNQVIVVTGFVHFSSASERPSCSVRERNEA